MQVSHFEDSSYRDYSNNSLIIFDPQYDPVYEKHMHATYMYVYVYIYHVFGILLHRHLMLLHVANKRVGF